MRILLVCTADAKTRKVIYITQLDDLNRHMKYTSAFADMGDAFA